MTQAQATADLTERELELSAIIASYNDVTEQLRISHERLGMEVQRLREELARKNEQLRRRERLAALGEMAAGVAHEIRNPLAGIQLQASLLVRDLRDRPNQQRLAGRIVKYVGSLEGIVSDILDFGRPGGSCPCRVSLGDLISDTVELVRSRCRDQGASIEIDDALAAIELFTDPSLLQRALLNLMVNAVEAVGPALTDEGHVWVRPTSRDDDQLTIEVADDGPGIDAELLDRVFNPFFTTKDIGTGLGLAIVHQIAETLGGHVRAGRSAEGGASFVLTVPVRAAEPQSFQGSSKEVA